jgi:hypothetical protein
MSTLGLAAVVALMAAALLAGVLRLRRRRPAPRPGPRTVAELVQLRAAAARSEPAPAADVQAEVPSPPGSTSSETEADEPAVSEPVPVAATARSGPPAAKRNGRGVWASSADTPWGRARRMTDAVPPAPPMTNGQVGHRTAAAADDSATTSGSAKHLAPTGSLAVAAPAGSATPGVQGVSGESAWPGSLRSALLPATAQATADRPRAASDSHPTTTADLDDSAPAEASPVSAADSRPAPAVDLNQPAPTEVQLTAASGSRPAPAADLDSSARAEPQPVATADRGRAPEIGVDRASAVPRSAAADSRPAPTPDLDAPAPVEPSPVAVPGSHPGRTLDLDEPAPVEPQPAVDSRPAPTPDLDAPAPVEPSPVAVADSDAARTVDLDGPASAEPQSAPSDARPDPTGDLDRPAPAQPQPAAAADPHPVHAAAPEPGETEEQASRRVLHLVPPLPVDSAIPVQRTQAPDSELALLGALGLLDPAAEAEPALTGVDGRRSRPEGPGGPAQQIRFRVARRDGSAVPGAEVDLLDEDGQHVATGYADADGCGELQAPHPGSYLMVCVAPEHQPGVATVSVGDGPGEAALLVARSAVLTGSVRASYTPVVAARLTVVQDGEIVGGTHSDSAGAYRISDLGPGGYGLCVTAPGCVPAAVRIDVADGTELQRDIDLQRAGDAQHEVVESPGELPEQATAADRRVVGNR